MWNLPNIVTLIRISMTPVVALLPFIEGYWPKFVAFLVFVIVALTDILDGYLARSRNQITDLGKLLDPLADKLLLLASLIPIYWISRTRHDLYDIPVWGSIPLWVCVLMLGREFAMTMLRWWGKRRGIIISAGGAGKLKTAFQSIFIGGIFLWFAFRDAGRPLGWEHTPFFAWWSRFHGGFVAIALLLAVTLTVYSFVVYLYRYRALFSQQPK
ncbi:MAG: CDP-diacylglycerol--glycerol-3-phosphate 3-phosphatidyltransferase [Betaproteobacteria bacterium]|jgi:CDP-diacylglycerol--glycerol-3-phosphate 3-phosphatidyltransferase|nr:CDP-diacylglycerol--glycerol-3-phosphate 3-phosphatidyltransferase [Betaproteobacteria bacterium]